MPVPETVSTHADKARDFATILPRFRLPVYFRTPILIGVDGTGLARSAEGKETYEMRKTYLMSPHEYAEFLWYILIRIHGSTKFAINNEDGCRIATGNLRQLRSELRDTQGYVGLDRLPPLRSDMEPLTADEATVAWG